MQNGFFDRVYEVVCRIPCGKVSTYGQIARILGNPCMSRQVGWALHVNPFPGVVPCHRVVNRFGGLAPSFAFGGIDVQAQLLANEGVEVVADKVDLSCYLWQTENEKF